MRVRIDFTVEIPDNSIKNLTELAAADTLEDVRAFVKNEPEDYIIDYLTSNGVKVKVVRRG